MPATGRSLAFPYCVVAHLQNGEIAELDEYFDQLAMLQHAGLVPSILPPGRRALARSGTAQQ